MDDELNEWLARLKLQRFVQLFEEHEITWSVLFDLTEADLREMGLPIGPRRQIASAIAARRDAAPRVALGGPDAGAAGVEPKPVAERRPMTIVFCDMVGYTPLTVRHDPEDVRAVVLQFQECIAAAMRAYDGHVAAFLGDGVLAFFGWPHAFENQAERATLAAVDALQSVAQMTPVLSVPVRVRAGIASGRVVVGSLGEDSQNVTGETVNLAQRLQDHAKAGEAVMDATTRRLVGNAIDVEPLGPVPLKGFPEPVDAFRVKGAGSADSRFDDANALPLLGRDAELSVLEACWSRGAKGSGEVVVLEGEAGVGKSRLLRAFRDAIADEAHVVLYQCLPHYANSALYPVKQRLIRDAQISALDAPEVRFEKLKAHLATISRNLESDLPLVAQLLSTPVCEPYSAQDLSAAEFRAAIVACIAAHMTNIAEREPLCLFLEDAHWIDPTTEDLLVEITRLAAGRRALAVVTHRPEYHLSLPGGVRRTDVSLGRMSQDASVAIARACGGTRLPQSLLDTIVERAQGIPLYIEGLTQAVIGSDGAEEGLPSIQALFVSKLDSLGEDKALAQLVSTISRGVSVAFTATLAEASEASVERGLERLVRAGILLRSGSGAIARYRFKHILIQEAAYDTLLFSVRRETHGRVADTILSTYPLIAESEPEGVARHLSRADRPREAIVFWQRAGEQSAARSAHREAVAHYRDGLADLARLNANPERDAQEFALHVSLGASLLTLEGWSSPDVARHYDEALRLCAGEDDAEHLFVALRGKANVFLLNGQLSECHALAEQLSGLADQSGEPALVVAAAAMSGICALLSGRFSDAIADLERVLSLYEPARDQTMALRYGLDPAVVSLSGLSWAYWFTQNRSAAHAAREAALSRAMALDHAFSTAYALGLAANLSQFDDDPDDARRRAEIAVEFANEQGFPYWVAWGSIVRGWAITRLGSAEAGVAEIEKAIADYLATGAKQIVPYAEMLLAESFDIAGAKARSISMLGQLERRESGSEAAFFAPLLSALRTRVLSSDDSRDSGANEANRDGRSPIINA